MDILEEIMKNASEIPLECQIKIRDVTSAMVFTKNVILNDRIQVVDTFNNKNQPQKTA